MINLLLSLLSGFLLALTYPRFNLGWLAWFALLPLLYAVYKSKHQGSAALYGLLAGLPFYLITFAFMLTLGEWAGNLIYPAWVLLALFYSLYTAFFAFLLRRYASSSYPFMPAPLLWVLIEWLRSLGPFGVVAHLGYSQWLWPALTQIVSLTGVAGLSFLVVLVNALLAELLFISHTARNKTFLAAAIILSIGAVWYYGYYQLQFNHLTVEKGIKLALIQGNFTQNEKLDYANLAKIKETYFKMSQESLKASPAAIVWPETAIPFYIQDDFEYIGKLRKLAKDNRVNLILGLPRYDRSLAYNSTLFISSGGEIAGWQDKHKLVPFGEYVPFRPILIPLFKTVKALRYTLFLQQDFSPSYSVEPVATPAGKVGVGICSDVFFPAIFREFDRRGVDYFLVNANDAWYQRSSASIKHLGIGAFRAIEFRRYLAYCTTNGITAIIDPWGRVVKELKPDERDILYGKIYKISERSFYSRFGDLFTCLVLVILGAYLLFRKRSPKITAA